MDIVLLVVHIVVAVMIMVVVVVVVIIIISSRTGGRMSRQRVKVADGWRMNQTVARSNPAL